MNITTEFSLPHLPSRCCAGYEQNKYVLKCGSVQRLVSVKSKPVESLKEIEMRIQLILLCLNI